MHCFFVYEIQLFVNSSMMINTVLNACCIQFINIMEAVFTPRLDMLVFYKGILTLTCYCNLKGHVDKPVHSDGIYSTGSFGKVALKILS